MINQNSIETETRKTSYLPQGEALERNVARRHLKGRLWKAYFMFSLGLGLLALIVLLASIINDSMGLTAVVNTIEPETLTESGQRLESLSADELQIILSDNLRKNRLRTIMFEEVPGKEGEAVKPYREKTVAESLKKNQYASELAGLPIFSLEAEQYTDILARNLSHKELEDIVVAEIVEPRIEESYNLLESILNRSQIEAEVADKHPTAQLELKIWLSWDFIASPLKSSPETTGMRTAVLGSLWMITFTILFAFPLGLGAAIYLEEYATDNWLNKAIQTNIYNLAGVPSIIYGLLGVAIFVRAMSGLTQGRTIISGSLTMALLILPIIIIASQEAIRAVPDSLRQASYGLGATKWQTIWHHVLPYSPPGIMTGTILAISRAIGETAPLIIVGASTFILRDPDGPFSSFTVLPIQIYRWTQLPTASERDVAAAAIIILLVMLLSLNATAIYLRNRFSRRLV